MFFKRNKWNRLDQEVISETSGILGFLQTRNILLLILMLKNNPKNSLWGLTLSLLSVIPSLNDERMLFCTVNRCDGVYPSTNSHTREGEEFLPEIVLLLGDSWRWDEKKSLLVRFVVWESTTYFLSSCSCMMCLSMNKNLSVVQHFIELSIPAVYCWVGPTLPQYY